MIPEDSTFPSIPVVPPVSEDSVPKAGFALVADPLTAGFQAAAAFFNFLSTAQGQIIVADILKWDAQFAARVHDVFVAIHKRINR